MLKAISNTSPLLYLYRARALELLPALFDDVWIPEAVASELAVGGQRGYDVPVPASYEWLKVVNPKSIPSEWLVSDLGTGEIAAIALTLEHPERIILLDDMLARRTAQAAGLRVWGTLKVLLEAKARGRLREIEPFVTRLSDAGMWISSDVRRRILALAGET